ncbi:hypothetical protein BX600DRAFT_450961 [Xylariales sp. PMI_506]|nr:hypothetical protein BX600DRAFT_450961 [Xylariales sp. PMI_506]
MLGLRPRGPSLVAPEPVITGCPECAAILTLTAMPPQDGPSTPALTPLVTISIHCPGTNNHGLRVCRIETHP